MNQKFTWKDFLESNPEFKAKGIKRTSAEGKKAFEAAFKARLKDILKERLVFIEKEESRATSERLALTDLIKATKKPSQRKIIQEKIGRKDRYLSRLSKMAERTKMLQKSL